MSHTKIKDPKKNAPAPAAVSVAPIPLSPTLGTSQEELISEFKKFDALLAGINAGIQAESAKVVASNRKIEAYRAQGHQLVGQANTITRILAGSGIDTQTLSKVKNPNLPDFSPVIPEIEAEVPEPEEVKYPLGLKNRFPR